MYTVFIIYALHVRESDYPPGIVFFQNRRYDDGMRTAKNGEKSEMAEEKEYRDPNRKAVVNRLARASGHLEMVRRMVEEGRSYNDVLIQLAAVKAAINNTGKVILKDYMKQCLEELAKGGDREALDELNRAVDQFIK